MTWTTEYLPTLTEEQKDEARKHGKEPCLLSPSAIHDYEPIGTAVEGTTYLNVYPSAKFAAVCRNCGEWTVPR